MRRGLVVVWATVALAACGAAPVDGTPDGQLAGDEAADDLGGGDLGTGDPDEGSTGDADGDGLGDAALPDADPSTPTPTGCIDEVTAGDHVFECEGLTYDVRVPQACLAGGCGLIVDIHGFTCSGRIEDNNTNLRALGATHGYIVVQPTAPGDVPATNWIPYDRNAETVWGFLELAIDVFGVDLDRVHATGFSQGAGMTFELLCNHADALASVAPAAEGGDCFSEHGAPSREVDVLFMFGTNDGLVPYTQRGVVMRDHIIDGYGLEAGVVADSGGGFTRTQYMNTAGTVLEFLSHDYSASSGLLRGHCYPGSDDDGGEAGQLFSFACVESPTFHWGEEVMEFFIAHPRN